MYVREKVSCFLYKIRDVKDYFFYESKVFILLVSGCGMEICYLFKLEKELYVRDWNF